MRIGDASVGTTDQPREHRIGLEFDLLAVRELAQQVLAQPRAAAWIDAAQRAAAAAIYGRTPKTIPEREVTDLFRFAAEEAFRAHWTLPARTAPVAPDALRADAARRHALAHWPEHAVTFAPLEADDPRRGPMRMLSPRGVLSVSTWMALPDGSTVDKVAVTLHAGPSNASASGTSG